MFGLEIDSRSAQVMISLAWGLVVLAAAAAASGLFRRKDPAWRRLDGLADQGPRGLKTEAGQGLGRRLQNLISRLSAPAKPREKWQLSQLRQDLMLAGFRAEAVNVFLGLKVLSTLAWPALLVLSPLRDRLAGPLLAVALAAAGLGGHMLPGIFLSLLRRRRAERITKELPDVLDLLVIAVEAGLGLDAAVNRVGREMVVSAPALARELALMSLELKAGIPRNMALKNLAARCGVDEVSSLVSMLTQADRFGVSVGRSLRVHSDAVRTKRRQRLEEKAAKVPLKLLFPVLFLIFPAIMVVVAGPAVIRVSESIMK